MFLFKQWRKPPAITKTWRIGNILEEFGIEIPNEEIERLEKVQQLYDVIWKNVNHAEIRDGKPYDTYRWLCDFLSAQLKLPASFVIAPDTNPNALLPRRGKAKAWRQVQLNSPYELPSMEQSTFNRRSIWVEIVVLGFAAGFFSNKLPLNENAEYGFIALILGYYYLRTRRKRIPQQTMEELANDVVYYSLIEISDSTGFTEKEILQILETDIKANLPEERNVTNYLELSFKEGLGWL